jgi:hypothetical protein
VKHPPRPGLVADCTAVGSIAAAQWAQLQAAALQVVATMQRVLTTQ